MKNNARGIPVIAISGFSGSGKTTIIEKLILEFNKRKINVSVIKHDAHNFEIDKEGKDSYRFTAAGAKTMIISSETKTARVELHDQAPEITELLDSIEDSDLILVEGYKNEELPRIGISRKATGKGFAHSLKSYMAVISDENPPYFDPDQPWFGLNDVEGISDFIEDYIKGEFA